MAYKYNIKLDDIKLYKVVFSLSVNLSKGQHYPSLFLQHMFTFFVFIVVLKIAWLETYLTPNISHIKTFGQISVYECKNVDLTE